MSSQAEKLNRLMQLLGDAARGGESFPEFCKAFTVRKNKEHALAFGRTPYARRLLLLPQCLRSTAHCQAVQQGPEYICQSCGSCKVQRIVEHATELGYGRVCVLKGGSALVRLIQTEGPGAVLGVACELEGMLGILECERLGVPVQFVPLLCDGCADTDVDLADVGDALEFQLP